MNKQPTRSTRKQRGAATIEYALIVAAVVALSTAVFSTTSGSGSLYDKIMNKITSISF